MLTNIQSKNSIFVNCLELSRFYSHLNTAKSIISLYKGEMPLAAFLKNFFAREKKYGSKDRKTISSLCYNYFRIGTALPGINDDERLIIAAFIFSNQPIDFFQLHKPEWDKKVYLPLQEKLTMLGIDVEAIFPFNRHLSEAVDGHAFNYSFLVQPELFVRVRPGKHASVVSKLTAAQIPFSRTDENCLAFPNGTKLEQVVEVNREIVIQDLNSQRVAAFFPQLEKGAKVWDCCAASGGKSLMAYDLLPKVDLTVSDIRQSIIQNLQSRFKEAGITNYRSIVADATSPEKLKAALGNSKYDLVICDAPCSGSGTWSRTPEQLLFFKEEEIKRYSNLQKRIAGNAIPYINKAGYLLYITCSVFKEENEEVVQFLQDEFEVSLVKMELLTGYNSKADTMFAALFQLR